MNKTACVAVVAAFWVAGGTGAQLQGADGRALLLKQVPDVDHTPKNYDEMVANIEGVSGFKVKADPGLAALLKQVSWSCSWWPPESKIIFLNQYLDRETSEPCLQWELDADTRRLTLTPAWQTDDARSTAELLKALREAYAVLEKKPHEKGEPTYTDSWREARKPSGVLLNALLSKKENYEKAWKPRTLSFFEPDPLLAWDEAPDICLACDFKNTAGQSGVLVVVRHQLMFTPGEGGFEYYYFTPEGKLLSADLLSGGWRMSINSVMARAGKTGARSELLIKGDFVLQTFVMKPDKIALTGAVCDDGTVMPASEFDGHRMGKSLVDETLKAN